MKKRLSLVANFFAFNLLFFALYLNFIKEDNLAVSVYREAHTSVEMETVLLQNAAPYEAKQVSAKVSVPRAEKQNSTSAPLRLSFN
jgi:hypothetical protein